MDFDQEGNLMDWWSGRVSIREPGFQNWRKNTQDGIPIPTYTVAKALDAECG